MPDQPERKIEELLRAYAAKRRQDAGAPLQVHPVTRRLLQAEAARLRPPASPPPQVPWWHSIALLWPRLAFAATMLAALGICVWWMTPKGQPSMNLAKNEAPQPRQLAPENVTAKSESARPEEPSSTRDLARFKMAEKEARLDRVPRPTMAPPPTAPAASPKPTDKGLAEVLASDTEMGEGKKLAAPPATPAPAPMTEAIARSYGTITQPELFSRAAPAGETSRSAASGQLAPSRAAQPRTSVARRAIDVQTDESRPSAGATGGELGVEFAPGKTDRYFAWSQTGRMASAQEPSSGSALLLQATDEKDRMMSLEAGRATVPPQVTAFAGGAIDPLTNSPIGRETAFALNEKPGVPAGSRAMAPTQSAVAAKGATGLTAPQPVLLGAGEPGAAGRNGTWGELADGVRYRFISVSTQAVDRARRPASASTNALALFDLKRIGERISIVDADGSIYEGSRLEELDAAPTAFADAASQREEEAIRTQAEKAKAIDGDRTDRSAGTFLRFRVAGTNRTLRQPVVVQGVVRSSDMSALDDLARLRARPGAVPPASASPRPNRTAVARPPSSGLRVEGRMRIGNTQSDLQAIRLAPEAR